MEDKSLEKLLALFEFSKKSDVVNYCHTLTISSEGLSDLILAGHVNALDSFKYLSHFIDITPEDLEFSDDNFRALTESSAGKLSHQAQKTLKKLEQTYKTRRLLAVHLFYTESHKFWHIFYFDQRDYQAKQNHWEHGSHIHYTQDLFTNQPLSKIWSNITKEKPSFPPALHVRYDYHHNRNKT